MKRLITILLIVVSTKSFSQEKERILPDYYTIGYFGEKGFHFGLIGNIGYELFLSKDSLKRSDRLDYGLALNGYFHLENHIGFHFKSQLTYYHIFGKSFELGIKTEIGYMRRFYQGETFEVSGNGGVNKVWLAGQNAFIYGAYISFGQTFWLYKNRNSRWFIEMGAFWEYPYNNYSLIHPSVAIGISKKIE